MSKEIGSDSFRQQTFETVDALASFEAEGEDREPDVDGEPPLGSTSGGWLEIMELERDTADDEPDHDNEPDYRTPDHRC